MQKRCKNDPKTTENDPKTTENDPKTTENDPKTMQKRFKNDAKTNMSVKQLKDSFFIFLDEDIDRFKKANFSIIQL